MSVRSAAILSTMSLLNQYGWNSHFEHHYSSYKHQYLEAGRVTAIQGYKYTLAGTAGTTAAELSGALLNGRETWELPKVGDWVVFKAYDEQGFIVEVLPRLNELSRKLPGRSSQKQVIAANIDFALILQGLDRDFNLMRLQRYLQQVLQCGIRPIVILNKKDLVHNPNAYMQQVNELGYQCPVLLTSALGGDSLEELAGYLHAGKTYALLGSSGAGKSTLTNALLGVAQQKEGNVSTANHKGRHTTTTRSLVPLPNGSLLIDSPGMREFGLTIEADDAAFSHHPQLEELSAQCRFRDCTHQNEPGCAVAAAVEKNELPQLVYNSYLKLLREQYHYQASATEKKRTERQFGRLSKQVRDLRKKRKY